MAVLNTEDHQPGDLSHALSGLFPKQFFFYLLFTLLSNGMWKISSMQVIPRILCYTWHWINTHYKYTTVQAFHRSTVWRESLTRKFWSGFLTYYFHLGLKPSDSNYPKHHLKQSQIRWWWVSRSACAGLFGKLLCSAEKEEEDNVEIQTVYSFWGLWKDVQKDLTDRIMAC